ncbi:MAG TPA: T3SS effector HopA1 family protein [Tahibacter sp.]|uniref:T3SS effector HopA1 family protein n=1 Tax=Tahibacter sp. TaxID=2056211 RepID=UPI002CDF2E4A|nr:T3SS effector HopA1 family protein [Tahibacter sp.]HSX59222.1 T3SS effector HopA1 family protein [Tahibacter sp.]
MSAPLSVPAFDTLLPLLARVAIVSPTRLRFGGDQELDIDAITPMTTPTVATPAPADAASRLVDALSTLIYFCAYTRPYRDEAVDLDELRQGVVADAAFLDRLSAANPTQDRWEAGWKVFRVEPTGAVHIIKGDVATVAQPGQYAYLPGAGRTPQAGALVDFSIARQSLQHQPGTYYAFGDAVAGDYDTARLSRFYFNVPSSQVDALLRRVGRELNRYRVPYRFKCPVDPQRFDRSDSAVLYVARRHVPAVLRLLDALAAELAPLLRTDAPLFTRALLPGVGAADEPGDGQSFGQSRARLLAQALADANGVDARRAAFAARLRQHGLDPFRPHLAPGLHDIYTLPSEEAAA